MLNHPRTGNYEDFRSAVPRDDDPPPEHELLRSLNESLDEVRAELEAAQIAETASFQAVDRARGDLAALGSGSRGGLLRLQRQLAAAQERTAVAESAVRAAERWAEASRDSLAKLLNAQRKAIRDEAVARARALQVRYVEALTEFLDETLAALEADLEEINRTYRLRTNEPIVRDPLGDGLGDQLRSRLRTMQQGDRRV